MKLIKHKIAEIKIVWKRRET